MLYLGLLDRYRPQDQVDESVGGWIGVPNLVVLVWLLLLLFAYSQSDHQTYRIDLTTEYRAERLLKNCTYRWGIFVSPYGPRFISHWDRKNKGLRACVRACMCVLNYPAVCCPSRSRQLCCSRLPTNNRFKKNRFICMADTAFHD